jgi:hypothetical protein
MADVSINVFLVDLSVLIWQLKVIELPVFFINIYNRFYACFCKPWLFLTTALVFGGKKKNATLALQKNTTPASQFALCKPVHQDNFLIGSAAERCSIGRERGLQQLGSDICEAIKLQTAR